MQSSNNYEINRLKIQKHLKKKPQKQKTAHKET